MLFISAFSRRLSASSIARPWRLACTAQVSEHDLRRILPLLDPFFVPLDGIGELRLDRIAIGHLDCRREYLCQRQLPIFGEHRQEPPDRTWRHCGEGSVL